jgi:hypothetical protein
MFGSMLCLDGWVEPQCLNPYPCIPSMPGPPPSWIPQKHMKGQTRNFFFASTFALHSLVYFSTMTSPEGHVDIVTLSLHVASKRLSSKPFNVVPSRLEIDVLNPSTVAILAWVVHEMGMHISVFFLIRLTRLTLSVITSGDAVSCSFPVGT